jgi:copper(I)-binding protein
MKSESVNQTVVLLTGISVNHTHVSFKRQQARATPANCVIKVIFFVIISNQK